MNNSTPQDDDERRSLADTLVFAGGAGAGFVFGLVRTKLQAVFWGPPGVGTIGLMQASISTATLVAGGGADGLVTREIAAKGGDSAGQRATAAALVGIPILSAVIALASATLFAVGGARLGFSSPLAASIAAFGVSTGVVGANFRAVLAGYRRSRDLAIAQVGSAAVSALIVAVVALSPEATFSWAVAAIAVPLAQIVVFAVPALRVGPASLGPARHAVRDALSLYRRAGALALAGVMPVLGQLLIRTVASGNLGMDEFGSFLATMTLSSISVSVLAASVGPSLLPQLSEAASNPTRLGVLIGRSIENYLTLYSPIVIGLAAMPTLATAVLFTDRFSGVTAQLPWQLVGEVFRLPCWVLATSLTARGRFRAYLFVEVVALIAGVVAVALASPTGSPALLGVSISCATLVQFLVLIALSREELVPSLRPAGRLAGVVLVVVALAYFGPVSAPVRYLGLGLSVFSGALAARSVRAALSRR